VEPLSNDLFRFRDTCNVYLLRNGSDGILIDLGAGDILDHLSEAGVERVTDVLMTHHHRDQAQGLPRAVESGIRIWVPHSEQELFHRVDEHWQARQLSNDYNNRQDRFSLLEPVPIAGTLQEYVPLSFGGRSLTVLPTPGHSVGSVSILVQMDGRRVCFTGDLICAPGKVWSLAATQWSYNGSEGISATILSGRDLVRRKPDVLLPSHGEPMEDPARAFRLLEKRLLDLLDLRKENPGLEEHLAKPFAPITPHFLHNRTSHAYSYILLSKSGKALAIDYGYDFNPGLAAGTDRAARRPWLYNMPRLKEEFGVTSIDVAIPTHYHDDHLASFNLLRQVEGTRIWAGENMVDVLERPTHYDLPCLWYDPIPVDRSLPLEEPFAWEEYELTVHPLPGHTLYAVAIEVQVDGKRILALGDQLVDLAWLFFLYDKALPIGDSALGPLPPPTTQNYVYRNRFRIGDYRETAELYKRVKPDIMVYGHWAPGAVDRSYLDRLKARGAQLERLHRDLLPLDEVDFGAEGVGAWIRPYRSEIRSGEELVLAVEVLDPFPRAAEAHVSLAVPPGWRVRPMAASGDGRVALEAGRTGTVEFCVTPPPDTRVRRARVAADMTVDGRRFGQQAEALVTVI
jgi:glyoxylase-like metal-dependent hydrolase (beta-lactamase superfamily II)